MLVLILNCFSSFIVRDCGCVALCNSHVSGGITVNSEMWEVSDSEWFGLQRVSVLLFTMPPSSALRTVFGRNVLSLPPCASLDLTGTLFFSTKNVLFLAHCVKTRLSHPVYVCVHWNNFPPPEGLNGLFSYMCWSPVCCASHCMQTHYITLCISRGATGPEW